MTGRPYDDSAVPSASEAAQGHSNGDMNRGQCLVVAPYSAWQAAESAAARGQLNGELESVSFGEWIPGVGRVVDWVKRFGGWSLSQAKL